MVDTPQSFVSTHVPTLAADQPQRTPEEWLLNSLGLPEGLLAPNELRWRVENLVRIESHPRTMMTPQATGRRDGAGKEIIELRSDRYVHATTRRRQPNEMLAAEIDLRASFVRRVTVLVNDDLYVTRLGYRRPRYVVVTADTIVRKPSPRFSYGYFADIVGVRIADVVWRELNLGARDHLVHGLDVNWFAD